MSALLAALSNPTQDRGMLFSAEFQLSLPKYFSERYWTCAALMIVFWTLDDLGDVKSSEDMKVFMDIVLDALLNPYKERPVGESVIGEITKQ